MIKSQLTLKQLEAFVCVVDMGSFRRAADLLGTTQPNVSNRIATLEDSLGGVLMHRDGGGIRLTDMGERVLTAARRVLWAAESLLEDADRRDLIQNRLRLGVTELVACTWLHPFLRAFRGAYPGVSVELEIDLSSEMERKLAARQIDLALIVGPARGGGSLSLARYPYVWVATPDLGETPAGLAELLRRPVLVHSRVTSVTRALLAEAARLRVGTDRVIYSSGLASTVQMALDGMAAALLPEVLVRRALDDGRLRRIACDWHPEPLEFHARFDPGRVARHVPAAAELAARAARDHGAAIDFIDRGKQN